MRRNSRWSAVTLASVSVGAVAASLLTAAPAQTVSVEAAAPAVQPRAAKPTQSRIIGKSVRGRNIVAHLFGPANATKVGVLIGSMHGTELGGVQVVRYFMKNLGPLPRTAMWVIPNLNPDGAAVRQRKNARGVDLNRNGTHLWKPTARHPDYYPGPFARSEPETRAYMAFLSQIRPDMVLIYHQAGNGVDSYRQKRPRLTRGLAKLMKLPVKSFSCDGECTGTLTGWYNTTHPGAAITIELTRPVYSTQVRRWAVAARRAIKLVPNV